MTTNSKLKRRSGGAGGVPPRPPSSSSGLFFLKNASNGAGGANGGNVDISLLPTPVGPGNNNAHTTASIHGPHGLNGGVGGALFKGLSADYGSALSSGGGGVIGGVGGVGATSASAADDVLKLGLGAPNT